LTQEQAFKLLMKQCFIPMWDDTAKFEAAKTIRNITRVVPFYRLFCLPEESAVRLVNDILFSDCYLSKEVQKDMQIKDGFILKNIIDEWIVMPTSKKINDFEGAIVRNTSCSLNCILGSAQRHREAVCHFQTKLVLNTDEKDFVPGYTEFEATTETEFDFGDIDNINNSGKENIKGGSLLLETVVVARAVGTLKWL
jgi:hypothetical protein